MAHQFQRTPINLFEFLKYYTGLHRRVRSVNVIEGVIKKRMEELTFLNDKPCFNGKLTEYNYSQLVKVTDCAIAIARCVTEGTDANGVEMPAVEALAMVRVKLPCFFKNQFWKTLGISCSAVADSQRIADVTQLETSVFECLLELGRDQTRVSRKLANGKLDPTDALPAELKAEEKQYLVDRQTAEETFGVKKRKGGRSEVILAGDIALEEDKALVKKQNVNQMRDASKMKQTSADGSPSRPIQLVQGVASPQSFETQFSGYMTTMIDKSAVELERDRRIQQSAQCVEAWDLLNCHKYWIIGVTERDMEVCLTENECFDCKDLVFLDDDAVSNLCMMLLPTGQRRFRSLICNNK